MFTKSKRRKMSSTTFSSAVADESPKKIFHGEWTTYEKNMAYSLEDEESCDVTVTAGSFTVKAHKAVLQSVFPVLKLTFAHSMEETNNNVVKIKGMKEDIVKSFLMFAYSNTLTIDNDNVQDFLIAADYFLMPTLKLFCAEFMTEQLSPENVFGVRHFAQHYHSIYLVNKTNKFIASNFVESTSGEEFSSLEKFEVVSLLSRPDLKVQMEEDIFKACRRWVEHSSDSRSKYIFELLQQVRLAVVKPDFLANVIATFPACKSNIDCQRLISNAALYHSNSLK